MNKPAVTPRPMGGFNTGFGDFNEHIDENAMQAATQQKTLAQQAGSVTSTKPTTPPAGTPAIPAPPLELGSIKQELVTRPAQAVVQEIRSFFDINALLQINPTVDSPETQAKKRKLHKSWQEKNQEQQVYAQKRFQEELEKKKQLQQQEELQKQQAEQARADTLVVPASPQKGPIGPGMSRKTSASAQLEHDRKTLSGPKSVN